MSLKLVLGRGGSGKTTYCLEEITALVRQEPRGCPLILLVPEQATLLLEKALVWDSACGGMMRIQVLSFQRLVRKLFNEVRGGCRVRISEVGRSVMLTKVLLDHRQELTSFAPMAASPGLVESISSMITELRTYRIFPHDLAKALDTLKGDLGEAVRDCPGVAAQGGLVRERRNRVLADKLHDLALIYRCYNEATLGVVHDWDNEMEEALTLLPEADFLRHGRIWVDGFKGFTPQERAVLMGLLGVCADMTVTLPLDPELALKSLSRRGRSHKGSSHEGSMFSSNARIFESVLDTYKDLRDMAGEMDVRSEAPVFLSAIKRLLHPMLAYLERSFGGYPVTPYPTGDCGTVSHTLLGLVGEDVAFAAEKPCAKNASTDNACIEIHVQGDVRSEVVAVVRRIGSLARDNGYKWREMAVMTRGLEEYRQVLEQEFRRHGVPFFMDDKRKIQGHALLTLVQALFNIVRRRWQMEDVFDVLRTGFLPLSLDEVDRLENLCLGTRVRGEDWERGRLWFDDDSEDDQETMDKGVLETFRRVSSWLSPLVKELLKRDRAGASVGEMSRLLRGFFEERDVEDCLETWAQSCEREGDFVGAQVHRQIWRHMLMLLEQMDALMGEVGLSTGEYAHIIDAGLRSIQLGVVPPRFDEVIVGALNRTRLPEVKVVFLIGCVQGILPPEQGNSQGLFDEGERAGLRQAGVNLDVKGRKEYNEELFYIYSLVAAPTDKLILSYPLSLNGSPSVPSFLVTHLRQMFPGIPLHNGLANIPGQAYRKEEILAHELALIEAYNRDRDGAYGRDTVYETWLLTKSSAADVLQRIREQVEGKGTSKRDAIPHVLTRTLYGQPLVSSVSQSQLYVRCPFAHFVRYGLRGWERKIYRLEAPEAGTFSHALMNEYTRMLHKAGENWHDVPVEEARRRLCQIADDLIGQPAFAPLVREARHRFMLERQRTVLEFSVEVLREQAQAGDFVTIGVEISFGEKGQLPALKIPLASGDELVLRGQIDRIDAVCIEDGYYVRVVDYKAREQKVNMEEVISGLDLQLPLYLEVAMESGALLDGARIGGTKPLKGRQKEKEGSKIAPGGVSYFALTEPVVEVDPSADQRDIDTKRKKSVHMNGLLRDDPRIAKAFGEQRLIKKDGSLSKKNCLSEEEFSDLSEILRSHLQRQGDEIMAGCVEAKPARSSQTHGCRFCVYHSICCFDPTLPGCQYRYIASSHNRKF